MELVFVLADELWYEELAILDNIILAKLEILTVYGQIFASLAYPDVIGSIVLNTSKPDMIRNTSVPVMFKPCSTLLG